jgi:RND family efflux transporter MFP subunit
LSCTHQQDKKTVKEEDRPVKIKTTGVRQVKDTINLHYSGTVEPMQTIPLSFENVGTITKVLVQEGDVVKKGQVLATIEKEDNESLNKATEAKYHQAKDAYDRLKSVYERGSLAEIKWIETETNLKEAESQMQLSKSSIDKCSLRAPTDGVIGKREVEPGQYSLSLKNPLEIVKIKTVLVKISVAENEISKIKKGQKATFTISALNGKTFEGIITNVGVVANLMSRTYDVKITVNNPDYEIKPGMVCDVYLNARTAKSYLTVPQSAVSKDGDGKTYVYVLTPDKKRVSVRNIRVGNYYNNEIEVIDGLSQNEQIIVEGKEKLSDNSLITL